MTLRAPRCARWRNDSGASNASVRFSQRVAREIGLARFPRFDRQQFRARKEMRVSDVDQRLQALLQRCEILRVGGDVSGAQLRGLAHDRIVRRLGRLVELGQRAFEIALRFEHAACSIRAIVAIVGAGPACVRRSNSALAPSRLPCARQRLRGGVFFRMLARRADLVAAPELPAADADQAARRTRRSAHGP